MSHTKKILRPVALVFTIALAVAAVGAASASAYTWKINGVKLVSPEEEAISVGLSTGSKSFIKATVLGQWFKLTSEAVVETAGTVLYQDAGGNAETEGNLEFTKLSVVEPAGCVVASPLKTTLLQGSYQAVGGTLYEKFVPKVAGQFVTIKIEKCAIAGSYLLKGTIFGLVEPATKELSEQPITFSPGINGAAGGGITLGPKVAEFNAEIVTKLKGAKAGSPFGVE